MSRSDRGTPKYDLPDYDYWARRYGNPKPPTPRGYAKAMTAKAERRTARIMVHKAERGIVPEESIVPREWIGRLTR